MNITIIGAGAWGTALASLAANQHQVTLWARDAALAANMQAQRVNATYLPGITLANTLQCQSGNSAALRELAHTQDLIVLATPVAGLRQLLVLLKDLTIPLAWLSKGFEVSSSDQFGLLANEIQAQIAINLRAGVFSGPSFAQEVARGQPTAMVAASRHDDVRQALVAAFHGPSLRVYTSQDVVGVEVGGAVKNVLAIAAGVVDGLAQTSLAHKPGLNARAALITRGLAEMTRLGLALGAKAETFMGLSGLGDLVLTATGDLSRNRKVGILLAQGQTEQQALASLGHVAEGVYCARTVVQRAQHLGVDMPIAQCVVALLDGAIKPQQAVAQLMGREMTAE